MCFSCKVQCTKIVGSIFWFIGCVINLKKDQSHELFSAHSYIVELPKERDKKFVKGTIIERDRETEKQIHI